MKSIKCNEFFCVEFNIPEEGITIDVIVIALAECQISLCKVFTWMLSVEVSQALCCQFILQKIDGCKTLEIKLGIILFVLKILYQ